MATTKSQGTTPSERYLAHLCQDTFLSMWSYPNLFRDQGQTGGKGDGKEICDLLVVCGPDIIIFSDKSCTFPNTGDVNRDWTRWFKRSIKSSAKQVYGAERWIREYSERVFVDRECTQPFPLSLAPAGDFQFHRVIVVLGAKERCQKQLGGSGSLILRPSLVGNSHIDPAAPDYAPFCVGQLDSRKGFIHVLDDVSLDIVLSELDTITDFVSYLRKKEALILAGKLEIASGEHNLMSMYLRHFVDGQHDFEVPENCDRIAVVEGAWDKLKDHPQYMQKKRENRKSYLWDKIIDEVGEHALAGTLLPCGLASVKDVDGILRVMAREPRLNRRVLAEAMLDMISNSSKEDIATRSVLSLQDNETAYVFQFMQNPFGDEAEYRKHRREYLDGYCFVFAWKYRQYKRVIGIATESGIDTSARSYDLVLIEIPEWTLDLEEHAERIQDERQILLDRKLHQKHFECKEYPEIENNNIVVPNLREIKVPWPLPSRNVRIGRNENCPCGSGLKFKRCCGRHD